MRKYAIMTDTGSDLDGELLKKYDLGCVPMHFIVNGKDYDVDLDWKEISAKDFYDLLRQGTRITSAQVSQESYKNIFKSYLDQGLDILYVATSSALSAGIKTATIIAEEMKKDYPDAKIICVDALRACFALGILAITASELRSEGKTIEETALWLEENKLKVNMIGSVESLVYLKRAGRVSAASAFFGGLLNIKPIIIADAKGQNFAVEKVKGRKTSFMKIAERFAAQYEDNPYQKVFISHADCIEEAEELKKMLCDKVGKELEVHIGYVGPGVGASVGPGMIGAYCIGKKVAENGD